MKPEILIVDDNPLTRKILKAYLEAEGFSVDGCESGNAALSLAKERQFGIFVIDYRMPGMNGDEVTALLRKQQPKALILGYSFELKEQEFFKAGADAFIMKEELNKQLVPLIRAYTPDKN